MPWVAIENLLRARLPGMPGGLDGILLGLENAGDLIHDVNEAHFTFVEGRGSVQGNSWANRRPGTISGNEFAVA